LQTALDVNETIGLTFETTVEAIVAAQRLANSYAGTASKILKGGPAVKSISQAFTLVSVGLTFADGLTTGWKPHHTADIGIDAIIYGIAELSGPAGWVLGAAWFIANAASVHFTGESLTQQLFDHHGH
jgi:hypothetical protein